MASLDSPSPTVTVASEADDRPMFERDRRALTPHFDVLFHSDELIVLNKPPDVRIDGNFPITVETYIQKHFSSLLGSPPPGSTEKRRLRFCHQLDFATSGVLCLGLTRRVAAQVGRCFEDRTTRKEYLALVYGWPDLGVAHELAWPVAEVSKDSFEMAVGTKSNPGKAAPTHAQVLMHGYFGKEKASKVLLMPKTGRRHQLRVHCVAWGHPIVGDYTYAKDDPNIVRMMLHAWRLFLPIKVPGAPSATFSATGSSSDTEGVMFEAPCVFEYCLTSEPHSKLPVPPASLPKAPSPSLPQDCSGCGEEKDMEEEDEEEEGKEAEGSESQTKRLKTDGT